MIPMFSMESAINPNGDTEIMLYVVLSLIGLCIENTAYTKLYQWSIKWYGKRFGETEETFAAYPPNRVQTAIAMAWAGIFTLFGLLVLIPVLGGFGICWTLLAGAMTGVHVWQFFVKRSPVPKKKQAGGSRLDQLESLKAAGLISEKEYWQRREDILRGP